MLSKNLVMFNYKNVTMVDTLSGSCVPLKGQLRNFASTNWTSIKLGEVNVNCSCWESCRSLKIHHTRGWSTTTRISFQMPTSLVATYLMPWTNSSRNWRDGPLHKHRQSCLWKSIDLYLGMRKPN